MRVLSTGEAAAALHTSRDMIRRLIKAGELKAERMTHDGHFRIIEADLPAYAQRQGVPLELDAPSAK